MQLKRVWVSVGRRVHKTADIGRRCECETTTHYDVSHAKAQVNGAILSYQHESMVIYNAYTKTCGIWCVLCTCCEYAVSHAKTFFCDCKTAGR